MTFLLIFHIVKIRNLLATCQAPESVIHGKEELMVVRKAWVPVWESMIVGLNSESLPLTSSSVSAIWFSGPLLMEDSTWFA